MKSFLLLILFGYGFMFGTVYASGQPYRKCVAFDMGFIALLESYDEARNE